MDSTFLKQLNCEICAMYDKIFTIVKLVAYLVPNILITKGKNEESYEMRFSVLIIQTRARGQEKCGLS